MSAILRENIPVDDNFVVYERKRGWVALDVRELWKYRELLYFLTWRDILVRYKQAVIGVAWAGLNPLLTMIVFTVVFNKALGFANLQNAFWPLLLSVPVILGLSIVLLKKQER